MSDHPGELDALPLADLLAPDSAATKLELRHALGLAWAEVLRLREAEARVRAECVRGYGFAGWYTGGRPVLAILNEGRP